MAAGRGRRGVADCLDAEYAASRLVARIPLSIFVFPLGGLLYTVAFVDADEQRFGGGYHEAAFIAFLPSGGVAWVGIASHWVLLWRTSVRWTAGRMWRTVAAAEAMPRGGADRRSARSLAAC